MASITNLDSNIKLEFNFLDNLPEDFIIARSEFEKWVPFILSLSTPTRTITISENIHAHMTMYEIKKIYYGLKNLFDGIKEGADCIFKHYSSESFFEISIEYIHVDECFSMEIWFIVAEYPEGRIFGYDDGFRFIVDKSEMKNFITEYYNSFKLACPEYPL